MCHMRRRIHVPYDSGGGYMCHCSPDDLCLAECHALEGILLPATDALAFKPEEVKLRHATCSLSLYHHGLPTAALQKKPTIEAKETYYRGKRDLL